MVWGLEKTLAVSKTTVLGAGVGPTFLGLSLKLKLAHSTADLKVP